MSAKEPSRPTRSRSEPVRPRPASGEAPAPRPKRTRSTLALAPAIRKHLEERGARSDRGHGPYNLTAQLDRNLQLFEMLVHRSNPRDTQGMSAEEYELVVASIDNPTAVEEFELSMLGTYLARGPAFQAAARERGIDPAVLGKKLDAYPFAEKLHLVDTAQVRRARSLKR